MPTGASDARFAAYQDDPDGFIADVLRSTLTDPQKRVSASVRDYQTTVALSANAVGKTHVASGVALWFLRTFAGSKVIATAAPPLENLERLLWGEIEARMVDAGDAFDDAVAGYLNIELGPEWWMVGRAIPQSGTAAQREAKFSGVHAPHLLFIVDEGDAVPEEVYRGIESCMSGGHVRLLIMLNPREATGPVHRMIRDGEANVVRVDAFSHPNVRTGGDVIPGAVDRETTVRRISMWSRPRARGEEISEDDPDWFQVPEFLDGATATRQNGESTEPLMGGEWREITNPALAYMVLARFPGQAVNQLIARSWVQAAQARWITRRERVGSKPPDGIRPIHGQDVAEMGVDRNAACWRYGSWVDEFEHWNGVDVLVTGDRAARKAYRRNARLSFVDATGLGAGVAPQMRRRWAQDRQDLLMEDYDGRAVAVMVSGSPTEEVEEGVFGTLRDQLLWRVREWLRTDSEAMLPPDTNDELVDELCTPRYAVKRGKLKVSDKATLKKWLGRSPDLLDALALTFADEPPAEGPAMAPARVARSPF